MKNFVIMAVVGLLLAAGGFALVGRAVYLTSVRLAAERAVEAREEEAAGAYIDAIRSNVGRENERRALRKVAEAYPDTEAGRDALEELAQPVVSLVD
jgi:hypothetical protein